VTGVIWLMNAFNARNDFVGFIAGIAQQYNLSIQFTQNLATACIFMSVVLVVSSLTLLVSAVKYRKMFI
jgi:hypothetical protein